MISSDDFQKIELKIARILRAEKVECSNKLLRLEVDLGEGVRQIVAGIQKLYKPEELIGREIVVVTNLEPRTLMGLESQGMLLVASSENVSAFLTPEKEVPPGTSIR